MSQIGMRPLSQWMSVCCEDAHTSLPLAIAIVLGVLMTRVLRFVATVQVSLLLCLSAEAR